jgi:hypothetical protein
MFLVHGGKCLSHKAFHDCVEKFSPGHSKAADDARQGRPVEIATIASVGTALGCSHGLPYAKMHDHLKFRKVYARWVPRELKDRGKKLTEWVCPCNISYGMHMKEKMCLTGLLLGTNHGCITTNPNQSELQCNGNIPVHLQPKSSKFKVTVFWNSQGVLLAHF